MGQKIVLKTLVDVIFGSLMISILFSDIFTYLDGIRVGLTEFTYEVNLYSLSSKGTKLFTEVDCDDYFFSDICETSKKWMYAGALFIGICSISFAFLLLSILSFFNSVYQWRIRVLKFKIIHFIYPLTYTLALLCYIYISEIYNLDTYGLGNDYQMKPGSGLRMMYICEGISIFSIILFFLTRFPCCSSDLSSPLLYSSPIN